MQIDTVTLNLRPRSMFEAADLGVRLVQAHARSVWRVFVPVWLAVMALALSSAAWGTWLPTLVIFALKPWLDRTLLFVMSRAVFGQTTVWADVWRAGWQIWGQQLWQSLVTQRLSPWRAYTQPVYQLEGQNWRARGQRIRQLAQGKTGALLGLQTAFAHVELFLLVGLYALVALLIPKEWGGGGLSYWLGLGASKDFAWLRESLSLLGYGCVVLALEPFYVAAGFAMYLNRRVELEGWDIEQELRRVFK
jgi:hypothetical protein